MPFFGDSLRCFLNLVSALAATQVAFEVENLADWFLDS